MVILEPRHIVRSLLLLLIVATNGTGIVVAQSPDLVTDRPDQTESATVVPRGMVQVETGYLFARDGNIDSYEVPGTLFRIGLGGRMELRLGHTGAIGRGGRNGAGDTNLGVKVNLIKGRDGAKPELAILGGLSLPTGDHEFSSDGIDPSFLFSFTHALSPKLSLGYNIGTSWESFSDQSTRDAFILYSLVLGVGLTDRLSTFLELFGDRQITDITATGVSVDGGLTFLLNDIVQFDVYVGKGLREPADDIFVGTGLSFRLPQ